MQRKPPASVKGEQIRITSDLSAKILKSRKSWNNIIQALRENKCKPRILYQAKLPFNLYGIIRTFQDKDKLKWFMSSKPALKG
jgi:hypothetical protein